MKRAADEFEIISSANGGYLGKGSFGIVKLAREKSSGILYAMKIV
jgi:serine/threonine protein kinase